MKTVNDIYSAVKQNYLLFIYKGTLLMLILSGFAQMPIFKRYYIADIHGLGWLAQFYVTHYLHYLFASLFLALLTYIVSDMKIKHVTLNQLTTSGWFRVSIILGLCISGVILVYRNFSGTYISPGLIIVIDITHLFFAFLFILSSLYAVYYKKPWLKTH